MFYLDPNAIHDTRPCFTIYDAFDTGPIWAWAINSPGHDYTSKVEETLLQVWSCAAPCKVQEHEMIAKYTQI